MRERASRSSCPGASSPLAAAPLQKQAAHDKELAERYPVHLETIEVEGVREREFRREPPRTAEQRFADALNAGSPELIAGRTYDGKGYIGAHRDLVRLGCWFAHGLNGQKARIKLMAALGTGDAGRYFQ